MMRFVWTAGRAAISATKDALVGLTHAGDIVLGGREITVNRPAQARS